MSETNIVSIERVGKAKALWALHSTSYNIQKIPYDLYTLTNLRQLFINYNDLEGSISSSIWDITSLENLCLFYNHLTGTIPIEICTLKELVMLIPFLKLYMYIYYRNRRLYHYIFNQEKVEENWKKTKENLKKT